SSRVVALRKAIARRGSSRWRHLRGDAKSLPSGPVLSPPPGKSMRLLPLVAAFSLAVGSIAPAQPAAAPDFSAARFKSHVAFLADDLLEGRDTGSRGHELGAAYVASQVLGLGLKPGGANGSRYQQVPF